jgi:tetratricopeptide (TPR) repeat protein
MLRSCFVAEAITEPESAILANERYSIMLSSTYRELMGHREAVRQVMLGQGLLPLAMEADAALPDHDLISASLAKVDEADAYVGLIGYRYGQVPASPNRNPENFSLTELEFRRAVQRGIPICMFIMHDDHPVPRSAVDQDRDTAGKLAALIVSAKSDRIYAEFRSVDELRAQAVQSLVRLRQAIEARRQSASQPSSRRLARGNIAPLGNLPFVGRDDLLTTLAKALDDPSRPAMVALHGPAGVGKSELARAFARRHAAAYPGGTFMLDAGQGALAVGLARLGQTALGLEAPPGMALDDQALRALAALAAEPTLLIYDNVLAETAVDPWLPPANAPCHVVATSTLDRWGPRWHDVEVPPLSEEASQELIGSIAGADVAAGDGVRLAGLAGGLPVQIVPGAAALARAARRGGRAVSLALSDEAQSSFLAVYRQLEPPSRLLLHAAARLNPQRIPRDELRRHLMEGAAWSGTEFERRLDACLDLHTLRDGDALWMHQLFATFLRDTAEPGDLAPALLSVATVQGARLSAIAGEVSAHPNCADLVALMLAYAPDNEFWREGDAAASVEDGETIGRALFGVGRFAAARPWFERAVAEKEQGDVHGRVDHESLGRSLHQVGVCLSSTGEFAAARPWFERAVAEKEHGDVHRRVDHASLGASLHMVGACLSGTGEFAAARPWFERAVAEAEQGDVYGHVDHESLGTSLHQVGYCLSSIGEFAAARPWFERAVAEKEQSDVHGRLDHESLGRSLHQVGYCLSSTGEFAAARPWFERSVTEKELGDVYGRVDHDSVGRSLRMVGYSLSAIGAFAEARAWLEQAVAELSRGDIHGRVDEGSLAQAFDAIAYLMRQMGHDEEAMSLVARATSLRGSPVITNLPMWVYIYQCSKKSDLLAVLLAPDPNILPPGICSGSWVEIDRIFIEPGDRVAGFVSSDLFRDLRAREYHLAVGERHYRKADQRGTLTETTGIASRADQHFPTD